MYRTGKDKNKFITGIVAGVCFGAMALMTLFRTLSIIYYISFFGIVLFIRLFIDVIVHAFAAVAMFTQNRTLTVAATGALCALNIIKLLWYFDGGTFFLLLASAGLLAFAMVDNYQQFEHYGEYTRKLWFIPGILAFLGSLIYGEFWSVVFTTAGYIAAGMNIAYVPNGYREADNYSDEYGNDYGYYDGQGSYTDDNGAGYGQYDANYGPYGNGGYNRDGYMGYDGRYTDPRSKNKAYCDLVMHIILLLFTFGVWHFIWIYRMTEYLNKDYYEPPRVPWKKLLLCMFVPFYLIYWTYKSAQRVERMSGRYGMRVDISTLCLVLEIFVPIVPPIIIQDKVNNIINCENGYDPYGGSYYGRYGNYSGYHGGDEPDMGYGYDGSAQNGGMDRNNTEDSSTDGRDSRYGRENTEHKTGEPKVDQVENVKNDVSEKSDTDNKAPENSDKGSEIKHSREPRSIVEELKLYKQLLDEGIITQEEFDAKKKELL